MIKNIIQSTFSIFSARRVPAIGVIFSEQRDMSTTLRKRDVGRLYRHIIKRSKSDYRSQELPLLRQILHALQNFKSRKIDIVTTAWNSLNQLRTWIAKKMYKALPSSLKKIVKKVGRIEARLHKKMLCIRPRLQRRYGRLIYPEGISVNALKDEKKNLITDFIEYVKNGNAEDEEVQYIEDCFEDMERPRFGYRVRVFPEINEPCQLGSENPEQKRCNTTANANDEAINRQVNFFSSVFHRKMAIT